MDREKIVFNILDTLVSLENSIGDKNLTIDDFKDIGLDLLKLSDDKLEKIYNEIMQKSINTFQKLSKNIDKYSKNINNQMEDIEKKKDMEEINNFNF